MQTLLFVTRLYEVWFCCHPTVFSRLFAIPERGHSFKLFLPDSRVNCRQHFFAVHVLRIWNSLSENVVSAAHLSLFISRLVRVNLDQFLIGKMYVLLCVLFYISGFTLLIVCLYLVIFLPGCV